MQTLLSKIAGAGLTVMIMGLAGSASATLIVNAVGVYDSLANPNNVDYNATYSAGTGGATAANVTTASTGNGASYTTTGPFNAAVASAFAADRGGVIDWENTSGSLPDLTVKYGTSQTLTLAIKIGRAHV